NFKVRLNTFKLGINNFKLRLNNFKLRLNTFNLRINNFKLRPNNFKLRNEHSIRQLFCLLIATLNKLHVVLNEKCSFVKWYILKNGS
ncbi:hypothetical protein C0J52_23390, partial [Blattella germanica]